MPRTVSSVQLDLPRADPDPVRIHLVEGCVLSGPARTDRARPGATGAGTVRCASAAEASAVREARLRELRNLGYRPVNTITFTVPATEALHPQLDGLDEAFAGAWLAAWQPTLAALRAARERDGTQVSTMLLLPRFAARLASVPFGADIRTALDGLPHADKANTGIRALGAGPAVTDWLRTYYFPAVESALSSVEAHEQDSDLVYTFALGIWDPSGPGPLAALRAALATARDMAGTALPTR